MLFVPKGYTTLTQIVRSHLHFYFIARKNFDVVHSHFPEMWAVKM